MTLLAMLVRHICLPERIPNITFGNYDDFVGDQRLKTDILKILPVEELESVGYGEQRLRSTMNGILRNGLMQEIVAECQRRRETRDPISPATPIPRSPQQQYSPVVGPVTTPTTTQPPVYCVESPTLHLLIPQYVQRVLEAQCFLFILINLPDRADKIWEDWKRGCPEAYELPNWAKHIRQGFIKSTMEGYEAIFSALESVQPLRNLAVHRKFLDLHEISVHISNAVDLGRLFYQYGVQYEGVEEDGIWQPGRVYMEHAPPTLRSRLQSLLQNLESLQIQTQKLLWWHERDNFPHSPSQIPDSKVLEEEIWRTMDSGERLLRHRT